MIIQDCISIFILWLSSEYYSIQTIAASEDEVATAALTYPPPNLSSFPLNLQCFLAAGVKHSKWGMRETHGLVAKSQLSCPDSVVHKGESLSA